MTVNSFFAFLACFAVRDFIHRKVSHELLFIDGNEKASVTDFFIPERKGRKVGY
jgi:hypothetical protein